MGGEEARDCDWARKGTTVGKALMQRVAWACVEVFLGRKRVLGQDWPHILPKDPEALSICHGPDFLPGSLMTEKTGSGRLSFTNVY